METSDNENVSNKDHIIRPINKNTVHRICSGQVVLSLAIAMKELVENSIDAGATIIDVYLHDYGSELVEVSDNGIGVPSESFESLTMKHCTSKIKEFTDLQNLETLGFRGEALSSLCALSDLTVTTKYHNTDTATKITYDRNGKIVNQIPAAREKGTTVSLTRLFSTLPVRRKEFLKNLKKEFNKMCQLLYAYCLVSKGVKFTCTNIRDKGVKSIVVSTEGKNTVRENIINVFGPKQISSLIEINQIPPTEEILTEFSLSTVIDVDSLFSFEFLISSVTHGCGRSTSDRQFYYINSRPCEPTRLMRLVNEVYKQFNSNQYPFVYLNITTKSASIDVNIRPDKREVFLEHEKILLATVKSSLVEGFKVFPSTYKRQNLDISQLTPPIQGIKRNRTDPDCVKKGSILQRFKKKSKSDTKIDLTDFITNPVKFNKEEEEKIKKEILNESEEKLESLIQIACNLIKDDKESVKEVSFDQPINVKKNRKTFPFNISLDRVKKCLNNTKKHTEDDINLKFKSEIKSEHNRLAEEELEKQIDKSDFSKMQILGQFNKGFIITKLNNDLFLIDQHASDEKYNFEQLQLTTVVDSQVLVNPKPLELTAGNECLLIDNIDVFKKNGFSFKIDQNAPFTKRVSLTSIPISKNFIFGKDDIDEMLLMLQESSNTKCVPSKLKKMFASRACRKSIMIGTDLNKTDMKKLVEHMGQIEQPWNCPHGRPTMRHLINLSLLEK